MPSPTKGWFGEAAVLRCRSDLRRGPVAFDTDAEYTWGIYISYVFICT